MGRGRRDKHDVVLCSSTALGFQVSRDVHEVDGAGNDLDLIEATPMWHSFVCHFSVSGLGWNENINGKLWVPVKLDLALRTAKLEPFYIFTLYFYPCVSNHQATDRAGLNPPLSRSTTDHGFPQSTALKI